MNVFMLFRTRNEKPLCDAVCYVNCQVTFFKVFAMILSLCGIEVIYSHGYANVPLQGKATLLASISLYSCSPAE